LNNNNERKIIPVTKISLRY